MCVTVNLVYLPLTDCGQVAGLISRRRRKRSMPTGSHYAPLTAASSGGEVGGMSLIWPLLSPEEANLTATNALIFFVLGQHKKHSLHRDSFYFYTFFKSRRG